MGEGGGGFIADMRIKMQNKLLRHNIPERTYCRVVFGAGNRRGKCAR